MVKLQPRSRLPLCCTAAAVAIGMMAPALAGPSKGKHPLQTAVSTEVGSPAPTARPVDLAKLEALQSVVVAFIGERECDDLAIDYRRLDHRLRQAGLKPEDVGPRSPYGDQLDLIRREVLDTFLDNRRRACEQAWDLVGEPHGAEPAMSSSHRSRQDDAERAVSPRRLGR